MRKLYTLIAALALSTLAQAQVVFYEDFESGITNQFTQEYVLETIDWTTNSGLLGPAPATFDGDSTAFFYRSSYTESISTLTTGNLDLSAGGYKLSFWHVQPAWGSDQNTLAIYLSTDGGSTWSTIDSIEASITSFQESVYNLDDFGTTTATTQIRFSGRSVYGYSIRLDNVSVYAPLANDAMAVEGITSLPGCGLGMENVSLVVTNNGSTTITSIDAGFEVNAQTVTETFTVNLASGESDTLDFVTTADLSAEGEHEFVAWTALTGDGDTANDTVWFNTYNVPLYSTLPYNEGFESGNGGWVAHGTNSSWELGTPNNTIISEANNGSNAWVTNLTGDYSSNEESYVESPCFDFSALTDDPVFRFAHIFDTENCCDEGFIDISLDGGSTWNRLGVAGEGINWYDDSFNDEWDGTGAGTGPSQWRNAEHRLDGAAGQSSVRLRISFSSDFSGQNEGFGFDDIAIVEFSPINAGVTEIIAPQSSCGLGSETVSILVENFGSDYLVNYNVGYDAGAGAVLQSVSDTLFAGEIDTVTFNVTADLSVEGDYQLSAWTDVTGDGDVLNDSAFATVTNITTITSLPYMEDFENGPGDWIAGGTLSSWELGLPTNTIIDTAHSGINAWVTNLDGLYPASEVSYVESPCFDFSSLAVDPVFRFAFLANIEANWSGAFIQTSTDDGTTWVTVGSVGEGTNWYNNNSSFNSNITEAWDGNLGTSGNWLVATHLLDNVAGHSNVKVRVAFIADSFTNSSYEGFAFDDVEIFEQPAINAGVTEILSPVSGCGLSTETVSVVVQNFGGANIVDYQLEYNVGAGVVSELQTDTLFAGEIDTISFTATADLSATQTYNVGVWTAVVGDGDVTNDSLFISVNNSPVVSSLPYMEDFETGANGWYSTGTNGIWELGDPVGNIIDTAYSGVNAWVTNLDSIAYTNNQLSYLISPCFDLSGVALDPIIEFALISNSETNWDGAWLEVSTDAGVNWRTVGNFGEGVNWYNNQDEHGPGFTLDWWDGTTADSSWVMASHLLDSTAGEANVVLRFVFDSDGSNFSLYEGFGIDDISLTEQPAVNSAVTALNTPTSACSLTATETITVQVANLGSTVMDSVIIEFSLDNGTPVSEVFNNSLAVGADSTFTLSQTIDLSAYADYELTVWTATVADGDMTNDTMSVVITSVPTVSTLPYMEDFESGSGGWTSGGTNSSWELGEPATAFIDTANSGLNAWVTNLTGNYNSSEDSYVESPCLDFSAYTDDPVIRFAGIFRTEACCDEGWVDVSVDGGVTWTKLGAAGEGENWYNDVSDDLWNGTSGNANEWLTAEHILTGTAGQSDVKVRFRFSSDFSLSYDGFGLDDIEIVEQPALDLSMISFDAPGDGCQLGEQAITFTFWNKGTADVSGFDYGFSVNGAPAQTESSTATIASGDTVTITFNTELADLSAAGVYSIDVFTALVGDENATNDTLFGNMVENFGQSTPLSQTSTEEAFIPDNTPSGGVSELFFCGLPSSLDGCLKIDNVTIDSLMHNWMADVDLFLLSPAGDTLELSTDNGGSGDNMINVVFSDTSTNDITQQTSGIAPGVYHTEDPAGFAGLYNGQDPNGAWAILAIDDAGGISGTLYSWSMTFVDDSPAPSLNYTDTTICITQVLTVTADSYDSYLWSTGQNTQSADLFGNILGLGDHQISVTVDQDGCTGVSNAFTLTVDACAGVAELGALNIDIYPNPSNGQIVVDVAGETQGLNVSILDINGKLIQSEQIGKVSGSVRKAIDLSSVAKGMYFIKLDDGKDALTQKLIIQ